MLTVSGVPVVFVDKNTTPEPSSLMVAVPVAPVVPVLVAVKVKVSPLSGVASGVIALRTNKAPLMPEASSGICTKSPGV